MYLNINIITNKKTDYFKNFVSYSDRYIKRKTCGLYNF